MKTPLTAVLSGLAATLAACSPGGAADTMPMNASPPVPEVSGSAPQPGTPATMDPTAPEEATPPPIVLKEDLTDANPKGLASRLSPLLKVEVRSTLGGLHKVTLKAGEWTATRLLDEVAAQLNCGWRQEFRLEAKGRTSAETPDRASARTPVSPPSLPSPGRVTCFAPLLSFSRIVEVVRGATACRIALPDRLPTSRHRVTWKDLPMEDALAELARVGGFTLVRCVVLEDLATMAAEQQQQGEQSASESAVRKADASGWLTQAYGEDPTGPNFPWETVDVENMVMSAAPAIDLAPAEVRDLFEQLRSEATTRATVDALEKDDGAAAPPAAPMDAPPSG